MKLFVFDKKMAIRDPGTLSGGALSIDVDGVADGAEITLKHVGSTEYAVATVADSKVKFSADFLAKGGRFTLSLKTDNGMLSCAFVNKNGNIYREFDGISTELSEMWETLMIFADRLRKTEEMLSTLTVGYETE